MQFWTDLLRKSLKTVLFTLFCPLFLSAQAAQKNSEIFFVKIDSIHIKGTKITRKALILRELEFTSGDSIRADELQQVLERNRLRVLNLNIFSDALLNVENWNDAQHVALTIQVRESWYWFPSPVFELVDRNFNVWWKEFNHSLKRANYGLDYTQNNFTGHADVLNMTAATGYNQRFNLRYRTPALNRRQTLGLQFGASYTQTQEVAINTVDNKLVFFSIPEGFSIRRFRADASLSWRPGLLHTHAMTLERHVNQIADTIAKEINPTFFGNGDTRQQHFSLVYGYHYDQRNYRMFPTQGWNISLELRQNGLLPSDNLHLARARVEITKYTELNRRLSLETAIRLRSSLPRSRPPYANNQALGYGGDLVRGYEYYVMDGLDLAVFRTSLQAKVMDHNFYYPKILRRYVKRLKYSNVKAWLSLQNDIGYANDPWYAAGNPLTNRPLYAYGIGLDLILFNTRGIQMSWLRTITGQNGFYVRTRL